MAAILSRGRGVNRISDNQLPNINVSQLQYLIATITISIGLHTVMPRSHHEMETFSALLALCVGNSPVTGEFTSQRPVTQSFDVFFDLRLNKQLSKQSWGWWFEMPSRSLWRHCNAWNPEQNDYIFLNENYHLSMQSSLKFDHNGPFNLISQHGFR